MILSLFAFLATNVAGIAHADIPCDPSVEACASGHVENGAKDGAAKDGCDLACSGCHAHCHGHFSISAVTADELSLRDSAKDGTAFARVAVFQPDPVYGLKRPPKS